MSVSEKKKTVKILIPVILAALVSVLALVYFSVFGRVTVIQDETWSDFMPKGYYFELGLKLAKEKYRLNVVTVDEDNIFDESVLLNEIRKNDTEGLILVCPVLTTAVNTLGIDVKNEVLRAQIIGIGADNDNEYFDSVLVSNTISGWQNVAKQAIKEGDKVAVIYQNSSAAEARTVYESLNSTNVKKINKDDYGKLFSSEIMNEVHEFGAGIVICPHIEELSEIASEATGTKWITDYRFAGTVPQESLIGAVYPDIYTSVLSYLIPSILNENSETGYLVYEYRTVK